MKRSYLHVQHFVDGLEYVLDNWGKIPTILNISGTDILTQYMFMSACGKKFNFPEHTITPRNTKLKGITPRPIRGGLNVSLAKSLGVPLYSGFEGVKLL